MWAGFEILNTLGAIMTPEQVATNPQSMLWLLPLTAAIAAVYKATKLPEIKLGSFVKETVLLFGSIVGFVIIAAVALYAVTRIILE
jgi:hypothetical protein